MWAIRHIVILLALSGLATSCTHFAGGPDRPGGGGLPAARHTAHATVLELTALLEQARAEQARAQAAFADAMREAMPAEPEGICLDPADGTTYEQLREVVDLSAFNRQTPLGEAIDVVRNCVEPPLKITVLWRDLEENADIRSTTPISMEGLPNVRLSAGLKSLLCAVSNPLVAELDYQVSEGVVFISTVESLPKWEMETRIHEVPAPLRADGRTEDLVGMIQDAIEPESWFDLSAMGEGTISACDDAKLIVRQNCEVHKKIHKFLCAIAQEAPIAMSVNASPVTLKEQMQFLLSYRDTLEKELDELQDQWTQRQAMIGSLRDAADELQGIIADLKAIKTDVAADDSDSPAVHRLEGIIDRARRCADRCSRGVPGFPPGYSDILPTPTRDSSLWSWGPLSREGRMLWMRLTAKQAELGWVRRRIAAAHDALVGTSSFDPEVRRIQAAAQRLGQADARVHELERRIGAETAVHR